MTENIMNQEQLKNAHTANELKNTARVAIGFLAQFSDGAFSNGYAMIPARRVHEVLSNSRIKALIDAGAMQEKPEVSDGIEKRVFHVALLEQLAGERWDKIIKAGRECA